VRCIDRVYRWFIQGRVPQGIDNCCFRPIEGQHHKWIAAGSDIRQSVKSRNGEIPEKLVLQTFSNSLPCPCEPGKQLSAVMRPSFAEDEYFFFNVDSERRMFSPSVSAGWNFPGGGGVTAVWVFVRTRAWWLDLKDGFYRRLLLGGRSNATKWERYIVCDRMDGRVSTGGAACAVDGA
jgi:hypothetical protein